MADAEESRPVNDIANSARSLRFVSRALQGAAELDHPNRESVLDLFESAGSEILLPVLDGQLDPDLGVTDLFPQLNADVKELLRKYVRQDSHPDSEFHPVEAVFREMHRMLPSCWNDRGEPHTGRPQRVVVVRAWEKLALSRADLMPPTLAFAESDRWPAYGVNRWTGCRLELLKASWVCAILADALENRLSQCDPHRIRQISGTLTLEKIRERYPNLTPDMIDCVRKRLEKWRRHNEAQVQMFNENPDTGRRRYAYPVDRVDLEVSVLLAKRTK